VVIGAAAVETVTLRASAGSVPATGGTVTLTALVTGPGFGTAPAVVSGAPLAGVPVTFSATEGTLSSSRAVTDAAGEATTQLTTDRASSVTATAGSKTSNAVAIARRDPLPTPTVTFTASGGTPIGTQQLWTFAATVAGLPTDGTVTAREFTWDF